MTQNDALRQYLNNHGSVTRIHAFQDLGITNLWQRIRELEDAGYRIRREEGVEVKDRRGATCRVTRYHKDGPASRQDAPQRAPLPPDAPYAVGQLRRERGKLVEVTGVGIGHDGLRFVAVKDVA